MRQMKGENVNDVQIVPPWELRCKFPDSKAGQDNKADDWRMLSENATGISAAACHEEARMTSFS